MPYIKRALRDDIDAALHEVRTLVQQLPDRDRDGALNYTITTLVATTMRPETGWRYHTIARAYAVFMAAGAEFYRRVAGPYEDRAIEQHGDIEPYKH